LQLKRLATLSEAVIAINVAMQVQQRLEFIAIWNNHME
jgi:hypothetical protein